VHGSQFFSNPVKNFDSENSIGRCIGICSKLKGVAVQVIRTHLYGGQLYSNKVTVKTGGLQES